MGEQHPRHAGRVVGLVVAQPAQLGRGERGDQHASDGFGAAPGPPISSMSSSAARAERVSFQSSASRTGSPSASSATMPCCCPPTEIAAACPSRPPAAASYAVSQARGSTSVPGGWAAVPLLDDRAVVGVHQQRFGRLGGGVHAEDEGHDPIKYES